MGGAKMSGPKGIGDTQRLASAFAATRRNLQGASSAGAVGAGAATLGPPPPLRRGVVAGANAEVRKARLEFAAKQAPPDSAQHPEARAEIYRNLNGRLRDLAPAIYAYEFTGVYGIRNGIEVPNLEDDSKRYSISAFSMLFKDMRVTD